MQRFIQISNLFDDDYIYYNRDGGEFKIYKLDLLEVLDWSDISLKIRTKQGHEFWVSLPHLSYECTLGGLI